MTDTPHVVALPGSLRDASATRTVLQHALDAAADEGATTRMLDLREYDLPLFDADDPDAGDALALRTAVDDADAVLLGSPMYHGGVASPLKTALDHLGREEFEDTTVGLVATAGGSFPRSLLGHLRVMCRALDAWAVPTQVAIPNASDHVADGRLQTVELRERTADVGRAVVRYAGVAAFDARRAASTPADD